MFGSAVRGDFPSVADSGSSAALRARGRIGPGGGVAVSGVPGRVSLDPDTDHPHGVLLCIEAVAVGTLILQWPVAYRPLANLPALEPEDPLHDVLEPNDGSCSITTLIDSARSDLIDGAAFVSL